MRFEPLWYLRSLLTPKLISIFFAIFLLYGFAHAIFSDQPDRLEPVLLFAVVLVCCFGIFGLIFGQLHGDKYPARTLWPSGVLIGTLFMSPSAWSNDFGNVSMALVFFMIFVGGNVWAFMIWMFPRVLKFFNEKPQRKPWGVRIR